MKKFIFIYIVISLIVSVTACNQNSIDSSSNENETSATEPSETNNSPTNEPSVEPTPKIYELDTGGDQNRWFYYKYNYKTDNISSQWFDIVGEDIISAWYSENDSAKKAGTLDETYPFIVKFIYDNNISKEISIEVTEKMRKDWENDDVLSKMILTDEEIETIYSQDKLEIYKTFVSEYSILANGEIYTPYWLINHSVDDYIEAGIDFLEYSEKIEKYKGKLYNEEFIDVFEEKLVEFESKKSD